MPAMPSLAEQAEVMAKARDWPNVPHPVDEAVRQASSLDELLRRLKALLH